MEFRSHLDDDFNPGPPTDHHGWSQLQMDELRRLLYEEDLASQREIPPEMADLQFNPAYGEIGPWYEELSKPPQEDTGVYQGEKITAIKQPQVMGSKDFVAFNQGQQQFEASTAVHGSSRPRRITQQDNQQIRATKSNQSRLFLEAKETKATKSPSDGDSISPRDNAKDIQKYLSKHRNTSLAKPLDLDLDDFTEVRRGDGVSPHRRPSLRSRSVKYLRGPSLSQERADAELESAFLKAFEASGVEDTVDVWKRPDAFNPAAPARVSQRKNSDVREENVVIELGHDAQLDQLVERETNKSIFTRKGSHMMLNPIEDYDDAEIPDAEIAAEEPESAVPLPEAEQRDLITQEHPGQHWGDQSDQNWDHGYYQGEEAYLAQTEADLHAQLAAYYGTRPRLPFHHENPAIDSHERKYKIKQIQQWNEYYKLEDLFFRWQKRKFPVRVNSTFCGFPLHLTTTDLTKVRAQLASSSRFQAILRLPVESPTFSIATKCFPLVGGYISCWTFIGVTIPWNKTSRVLGGLKAHV
eukprot:Gregarina_sp_Poly_1__7650@NODE_42_length_18083_cov_98_634880_g36_i0_p4_GENE_NODE_42_length_18083_cov_98_634880_g36_i0NODE_42_length_18083_cov_98_634880_g36_i0_p4_ORF_typecomplete_len525_score89_92_NODE_42_length_18083_cov_98_634880_g36_i04201994